MKRFLGFISQIERSKKIVPKQLLQLVKTDVRSTPGHNLRKIMLCSGKASVEDVNISDIPVISYHSLSEEEGWKVVLVKKVK